MKTQPTLKGNVDRQALDNLFESEEDEDAKLNIARFYFQQFKDYPAACSKSDRAKLRKLKGQIIPVVVSSQKAV